MIISYNIVNICQSQSEHIVIRVGLKECSTNYQQFVYKINILYLGTLLSSLVLLNIRVCLLLKTQSLSHNKSLTIFLSVSMHPCKLEVDLL